MTAGSSRFARVERKAVDIEKDLVDVIVDGEGLPTRIEARVDGLSLGPWILEHMATVRSAMLASGAVVLTGFDGTASELELQQSLEQAGRETLVYRERSTPRSALAGNVYTSTEFPPDRSIALHNELTPAHIYPALVWFLCVQPAETGGATPVADVRKVLADLPEELADRFRRLGWRLDRYYGSGFGPDWPEAMQTDSREEVETYLQENDVDFSWTSDGHLRTTHVRPAIERHPATGEEVWFNHAAFWHTSALPDDVRAQMERELEPHQMPYRVTFGDGSPIADADIALVRAAYERHHRERPWDRGDLMIVDNLLSAHGRTPYTGPRKIVVAMTDPVVRPRFVPGSTAADV